ncbi:MAG: trehalose-phosphatase [Chloroflexi bacterium]|nr:trehalose-phosphatase [Chloroflexota bacterium]
MEHLFSVWNNVAQQVRTARHILLLADFDGTLTPLVESPDAATLSPETRSTLQSLAHQRGLTLGIISGRALHDLKEKAGVSGIIYAGNHGLEIEGPGLRFVAPLAEEFRPILRLLHRVLSRGLDSIAGAKVEDKGLSLSVHYRQVEEGHAERVGSIFEQAVAAARAAGKVRTTRGKKVLEVRPPVSWDKGKAVDMLMERFGHAGYRRQALPIFLGDDVTDEDAFRSVKKYGGISVYVGDDGTQSAAQYNLRSPDEVHEFLERLLVQYRRRGR